METRLNMKSKNGAYVESTDVSTLIFLRKNNSDFKGRHIKSAIQGWDDVVKENIIYPSSVISRSDFIAYNRSLGIRGN